MNKEEMENEIENEIDGILRIIDIYLITFGYIPIEHITIYYNIIEKLI